MILADIELPTLTIPDGVRANARQPRIDTSMTGAPDGAVWISCCYAMPHVDKGCRDGKVFLTVSVLSQHTAGDALSPHPQNTVPAGRLFVVDPPVAHWLVDEASWERKAARSSIGLQWEVPRDQAAANTKELIRKFNGRWLPLDDPRYTSWRAA